LVMRPANGGGRSGAIPKQPPVDNCSGVVTVVVVHGRLVWLAVDRQRGRSRHLGRRSRASATLARAWAKAGRSRSYTRPVSSAMASWSSAAGHAAPWGTVATGTSCTTVTSRSTSTTRSTTRTATRPDATARVSSQARWRHDDEHHFGVLPRAGSKIGDPHQPHARVCPGRRGARFRPSLVAATASPFVLVSPVFMHAPPPVCFVPTTLADRECMRCVAHRFRHFLGGALVVGLSCPCARRRPNLGRHERHGAGRALERWGRCRSHS